MSFGTRLKELRNNKHMSQEELGNFLNVGKSSISSYENGTREPSKEAIVKIAEIFGVTTDYLLGNTSSINDEGLTENQKLIAYSIDPDITDEEREAIIEMAKQAKKFRRRI